MHLTTPLAADLSLLSTALYDPAPDSTPDVTQTLLALRTTARVAVQTFVGLTATITAAGPVGETERVDRTPDQVVLRLTMLDEHVDPGGIMTSLRLPGPSGGADFGEPAIQIVLYAGVPGAFVDLAADIAFLNGHPFDPADLDQHQGLASEPDITGLLQTQTVIDEAVGVLLDRGRTHPQAHTELDTFALAANTDKATEASRILVTLPRDG